jgi:xylulokinase
MGVALSAAGSLDWSAEILGAPAADLVDELGPMPAGPSAVRFLPYLSGERTPHNDAAARGAFTGLERTHGRGDMVQAVLEGVAFSLKDCLDVLTMPLSEPRQLLAVGGGSRSRYWLALIATVLGLPIAVPEEGDFGAAFGAARLGLIAAEGADPSAICMPPPISDVIEPVAALADDYAAAFGEFRRLYPAIRGAMNE